MLSIQLLGLSDCPNTPVMRERLGVALRSVDLTPNIVEIDLEKLSEHDTRRGYGAPTVLVDGHDLMGALQPEHAGLGCRFYPNGVPSIAELVDRLREAHIP